MKITRDYLKKVINESLEEVEKANRPRKLTRHQQQSVDLVLKHLPWLLAPSVRAVYEAYEKVKQYGDDTSKILEVWDELNNVSMKLFGKPLKGGRPGSPDEDELE